MAVTRWIRNEYLSRYFLRYVKYDTVELLALSRLFLTNDEDTLFK